jgi:hypothetical protein
MSQSEILKLGPHVTVLPIVHGNGDFAWEVRRRMLESDFDCLAVPLPLSFQSAVESQILQLPAISVVMQQDSMAYDTQWKPAEHDAAEPTWRPGDSEDDDEDDDDDLEMRGYSYVPVDPCQGVIAAIRTALGEHIPIKFIDLETSHFEPYSTGMPDAYALKKVSIEQFASAALPHLVKPDSDQWRNRVLYMACQLRELSIDFKNILFVCNILDWPWVRRAFNDPNSQAPPDEPADTVQSFAVARDTLFFLLGEIPFVTSLYERARRELDSDANLSIDGIKELLIAARQKYLEEFKGRARKISPQLLKQCLKYIRNLTLIDHRFSPELITVVTAAQQTAGDNFALEVLETAKQFEMTVESALDEVKFGIDHAELPNGDVVDVVSRLPGPPIVWRNLRLTPRPEKHDVDKWKQKWNPYSQCSWPPEDVLIENFRAAVFDRAKQAMGADLAKTEKFTTSVKDGIDIRDTLRHWYEGEIYVKEIPPNRGHLDCAVMLFDSPADPRHYPWRVTWYAEHEEESTLAFFGTDFKQNPVGPGICAANYGGCLFIFPPRPIPEIWQDPRLDFCETLEERLLAAACLHSQQRHIALLCSAPPGPAWRRLAKRFNKSFVHLPLSQFSDSTVQQLRIVHVLNGKTVRSYAADYIRRA